MRVCFVCLYRPIGIWYSSYQKSLKINGRGFRRFEWRNKNERDRINRPDGYLFWLGQWDTASCVRCASLQHLINRIPEFVELPQCLACSSPTLPRLELEPVARLRYTKLCYAIAIECANSSPAPAPVLSFYRCRFIPFPITIRTSSLTHRY